MFLFCVVSIKNMSKNILPHSIEPLHLTDMGATLQGELAINALPRLAALLYDPQGQVAFSLKFGKDSQGLRSICGKIHTLLILECQRCLQPVTYNVDLDVKLSPMLTEKGINSLPDDYEPLLVTEEPILLADIIEDELLLNLPLVPKHEEGDCKIQSSEH